MTRSEQRVSGGVAGACSHAELIDAFVDGAVSEQERRQAEQHLADCSECRDEARGLTALSELLAAERLAPAPLDIDFRAAATRPGRPLAAAVAALAALVGGAAALLAGLAPQVESAAATLFDFTVTAGLVGAGLLDASWRGMSAAVSSTLQPAAPGLLFGGAAAVGLTVLLVALLRRGAGASARGRSRR